MGSRHGGWKPADGGWVVEALHGAPSGQRVLVKRAEDNTCHIIIVPAAPDTDVDVVVRPRLMAG
jgi:hypothetical protein